MCIAWNFFYVHLFNYLNHLWFLFCLWNHPKLFSKWVFLSDVKFCLLMLLYGLMEFLVPTSSIRINLLRNVPNAFPVIHRKIYVFHHIVSQTIACWICSPDKEIQLTNNGGLSYSFQQIQNQKIMLLIVKMTENIQYI